MRLAVWSDIEGIWLVASYFACQHTDYLVFLFVTFLLRYSEMQMFQIISSTGNTNFHIHINGQYL